MMMTIMTDDDDDDDDDNNDDDDDTDVDCGDEENDGDKLMLSTTHVGVVFVESGRLFVCLFVCLCFLAAGWSSPALHSGERTGTEIYRRGQRGVETSLWSCHGYNEGGSPRKELGNLDDIDVGHF